MNNIEFVSYIKIISSILKQTHNQELSTKLFKVLVITGSIQNILIASNIPKENYIFSKCYDTLLSSGLRSSKQLQKMFKVRNNIAHINDLISIMETFNEIAMVEIDMEFEMIIKVLEILQPKDFSTLKNTSEAAIESMSLF